MLMVVNYLRDAQVFMVRNGIDPVRVEAVIANPDRTISDPAGPSRSRLYGDGLVVVVGRAKPYEAMVLSVTESYVPDKPAGIAKAKGGGGGSKLPTTWEELEQRARQVGLVRSQLDGGHYGYFDGQTLVLTFPATSSDHRNVKNAAATLIRLGYDVRRPS